MLELVYLLVGVALGAGFSWALARPRLRGLRASGEQLALECARAQAQAKTLARRVELRAEQLERTAAQRDDYAKIASSHELKPFRWKAPQWVRKVWTERRYAGHPASNLEGLTRDFAAFRDEHVLVKLAIELLGGWKRIFGGEHEAVAGDVTRPLSAGESMIFEGPADRVLEQIVTFLRDDDTGFLSLDEEGRERWHDPDSPMTWLVSVDVLQGLASPPEVQFVEVLRVQQELVERVVERPVVHTITPDVAAKLRGVAPTQLVALVDVQSLDRGERRQLESAALMSALVAAGEDEAAAAPRELEESPSARR